MEGFNINFDTTNFDPDSLMTDEVILATFVVDKSGSIGSYEDDLNEAISDAIREWKDSHHSEKIMYSRIDFNENVEVVHGFQPISEVDHVPINGRGLTALYDASLKAVQNTKDYYDTLINGGSECKCMIFVFTDADGDNSSDSNALQNTSKLVKEIYGDEANFGNFDLLLFSVADDKQYTLDTAKQLNFTPVIKKDGDDRPIGKIIRDFVQVASESVSSGSAANITNVTF